MVLKATDDSQRSRKMKDKQVFIGVMGVTGAGKSTFIKAATDDEDIGIGHSLTSCMPPHFRALPDC